MDRSGVIVAASSFEACRCERRDMILYLTVTALGISILLIVLKLWSGLKYFRRIGVKSLSMGEYIISMAKCIFGFISVQEHFCEQSHPFRGQRFVGAFEVSGTLLMARSPEAVKMVCVDKSGHFLNHKPMLNYERDPLFGKMVFFMCDETWKYMRSDLATSFTSKKLRGMFDLISDHAKTTMQRLKATLAENQSQTVVEINISDLTSTFTSGFFCKTIFDNDLKATVDHFQNVCRRTSSTSGFGLMKLAFLRILPNFLKFQSIQIIQPVDVAYFRDMTSMTFKWRSERNAYIPDAVQALRESKRGWTIDDQSAQVLQLSSTFATTLPDFLSSTLYELVRNPDVYQRLKDEIDEVDMETNGNLTMDDLNNMDYMDMVISETFRKWPSASITDRICTQDTDLGPSQDDNNKLIKIKKGQIILINIFTIHNDPEYWPDPRKFDPNRFSKENKAKIKPYTYLPFGAGPRVCPANRQALITLKLFLYYLLLNFNLSPGQKTVKREFIQTFQLVAKVRGGTWLNIEDRRIKT